MINVILKSNIPAVRNQVTRDKLKADALDFSEKRKGVFVC